MRSLRKLVAFSAVGAAYAFLSWPANASTSTWDHNGSLMVLEEDGKKRKLVYTDPRGPLNSAGVKKGTVLFDGEEKSDGRLAGYAKLFRAGCDPVDYFVEGSFDKSKGEILLQGQAPIYSGQGCKITGYSDDNTASSLSFRQQGGAYASREDQGYPGSGYTSGYGSPQNRPYNPDDPAYADPRSAGPNYGDRAYTDPNSPDPRGVDPRAPAPRYGDRGTDPRADPRNNESDFDDPRGGYSRYSERSYADQQRTAPPYPRNDPYARRPNPDDPDADDYDDEQPAYEPYRPYWRWGN